MATGHWRLTLETILGLGTGGQRWIGSISVFTTGSMPANGVQHNQPIYGWSNKTALGIEHRIWLYTLWPLWSGNEWRSNWLRHRKSCYAVPWYHATAQKGQLYYGESRNYRQSVINLLTISLLFALSINNWNQKRILKKGLQLQTLF